MSDDYIAFDRTMAKDYALSVNVGQPTAPDGVTRVRVDGSGAFEASQFRADLDASERKDGREESMGERVRGTISEADASALLEQASLAAWGTRFPQRPGIPDEAIVVITFERAGRESASLKMWLRDAEKDEVVGPILEQLRRHLNEIAGEKLYL
jgi:hypothetical protein